MSSAITRSVYFGYLVLAHFYQGTGFWHDMVSFNAGHIVAAVLSLLSPLYIAVLASDGSGKGFLYLCIAAVEP